jgi:hypothetical protein
MTMLYCVRMSGSAQTCRQTPKFLRNILPPHLKPDARLYECAVRAMRNKVDQVARNADEATVAPVVMSGVVCVWRKSRVWW